VFNTDLNVVVYFDLAGNNRKSKKTEKTYEMKGKILLLLQNAHVLASAWRCITSSEIYSWG